MVWSWLSSSPSNNPKWSEDQWWQRSTISGREKRTVVTTETSLLFLLPRCSLTCRLQLCNWGRQSCSNLGGMNKSCCRWFHFTAHLETRDHVYNLYVYSAMADGPSRPTVSQSAWSDCVCVNGELVCINHEHCWLVCIPASSLRSTGVK